jgi:excinuclease ABC subunit C
MQSHPWQTTQTIAAFLQQSSLPESPGVYFFLNDEQEILYIGKATSLRDRVKSYFTKKIVVTRGPKIALLMQRATIIGYTVTDSVLEALLLEGELIRKYQPIHNTDAKDDKSYNRVVITKETFPRVLLVRDREIAQGKFTLPVKKMYGPFPSSNDLKAALKIIRKLFPYRGTCIPFAESGSKKPCFSRQLGLCPGVCTGEVTAKEYQQKIRRIELFFEGKKQMLVKRLEKEMGQLAKELRFEEAAEVKKLLFGVQHIRDMALVTEDRNTEDQHRIEGYDTAHLAGQASVGVMTVVQKGRVRKEEYRAFHLRKKHQGNDLSALREILERRLKHTEWPLPELMVIDGGEAQRSEAEKVLAEQGLTIPIVAVVKNSKHEPDHFLGDDALVERFTKEILLVNSEAHRFSLRLHTKKRSQEFLLKKRKANKREK